MTFFTNSAYVSVSHRHKAVIYNPAFRKIMRIGIITAVILTTTLQLFSSEPVKSQGIEDVQINLELKNESLLKAFHKIEARSPFRFMYRLNDIKDINNLEISDSKKSVEEFVQLILNNTSLDYKQIKDRILIIKRSENGSIVESNYTKEADQDIIVRGQIKDAKGESLPGVSIKVKGTSIGTSSDIDGRYSLNVPDNATLVFNYIGYVIKEVVVNNQTLINVTLEESATSLNEVVVTALGIVREKRALTYSTQNVSTKELTEARDLNVVNSLQGKVSGLSINSSGSGVGAPDRVILRGNRSISGDSQPLYVIDGVPVSGNPGDLNPDNIASLNVLKGPNAAAIYGAAAQNGVIIIETKKGIAGVTTISFRNNSQMMTPEIDVAFQNQYAQGISGVYQNKSESSWGPKMTGQMVPTWSISPADVGKQSALTAQPNNVSDFYQNGLSIANNLIVSMGSEKIQGNFSFTRTDANGTVPQNNLKRNDLGARITGQVTKKLSFDTKIQYIKQKITDPIIQDINNFNQTKQIYMIPRSISTAEAKNYSFLDPAGVIKQNYWNPGSTLGLNPYFLLNRQSSDNIRDRGIFMSSLSYNFSKALKLMVRGAYDVINADAENKISYDFYSRALLGSYSVSAGNSTLINGDLLLTYTKKINKDLDFDVSVGGNTLKQGNTSVSSNTDKGMIVPDFWSISNTLAPATSYSPGPNSAVHSLYAFSHLGWKNAVFLDITGRNDWSSTLPAANRSYFYPSVGLSAIISDLIPLPDLISFFKLRGSWASVGSGASPYALSRSATFASGGYNGFISLSNVLPNKDLKPEQTKSYEIGIDARLFKNRLGLNVTGYRTNTTNQLFTLALPPGSGAANLYTNGGDVQNTGIEIGLSTTPLIRAGDFTWETDLNFSLNRNLVKSINDERPKLVVGTDQSFRDFVVIQGQSFGQVYGIGFLRDANGNVKVGTDGVPLDNGIRDRSIANANPDWMGGITNTFSYKNLRLNFLIDHRQGGTVISVTDAMMNYEGMTEETLQGREGGLVFGKNIFPGLTSVKADGTPNDIQVNAQTFWRSIGGTVNPIGEAFVQSMTNTRLREVMLGYTLPNSVFAKLPVSRVQFSLVGRNLLYISRASKSLDADIYSGTGATSEGQTVFAPPTTRTYGLDLKIDFK